ncbi:MAG TPA: prolipoprotein diacylglyceryl transferase [Candidatus Eisenbacteria bacterium]|nr:prolipoprotein diacylglyceryl transferase [Candidatus Eisenbacteria bacterium]
MHPTLLKFHGLELHSYGLLLAIAFLLGIQIFVARARARGIPEEPMQTLALWILVLAIVGARALFVITHWGDYAADPLAIFRLWEGGLILYGGYVAAIAGGILYVRRRGIRVWRVGDAVAPSMALGIGIGRLGCFMNGCCFGLPTTLPWGVHFPHDSVPFYTFPGAPLHPSQLYLSLAGLAIFVWLLVVDRKPRFEGWLFWTYIAVDSGARFLLDFTRYYDATSAIGSIGSLSFNMNQVLSAGLILISLVMLAILSRRPAAPDSVPVSTHPAAPGGADPASPGAAPTA